MSGNSLGIMIFGFSKKILELSKYLKYNSFSLMGLGIVVELLYYTISSATTWWFFYSTSTQLPIYNIWILSFINIWILIFKVLWIIELPWSGSIWKLTFESLTFIFV